MDRAGSDFLLRRIAKGLVDRLRLRRREPWNWCAQNAGLVLLVPALFLHNAWFFSLAAMFLSAGLMRLPLPPMRFTELARLEPRIETLIGKEAAWLTPPLSRRKKRRILLCCLGALLAGRILWSGDIAVLGLAAAAAALLIVRRCNINDGIDP